MNHWIVAIAVAVLLLGSSACKKNPAGEDEGDSLTPPGRRDYTWKIDTLSAGLPEVFHLFSLSGSSPVDVWAAGSAQGSDWSLWHYDGVSWQRNSSALSSNLQSVFAFARNDVWMTDAPGNGIYHYDGQRWSTAYAYGGVGTLLLLNDIWGDAPNNIYAVGGIDTPATSGYRGIILHYDGNLWHTVALPDYRVGFAYIRRGTRESNKYYLMGTRFETIGDTSKIYEFDGSRLRQIYSGQEGASVCEMEGRMYFPIGKKIFKYQSGEFVLWKDFTTTTHLGWIAGRNEADFFTLGSDGLTHYDGRGLTTLFRTDLPISGILLFAQDIFFVLNFRIMVHGSLQ